jgi:hypothetical protein
MSIACRHYFYLTLLGITLSIAPVAQASSNFDGFFIDAGVGYRNVNTSTTSTVRLNGTVIPSTLSAGQASNAVTVFSAGYNFPITSGYILGIGANISPASGQAQQVKAQALNQTITLQGTKPLYNYGFFIAPSLVIGDGLAYLKLGTQTQVNNSNTGPNFNGYLFGLGYKQLIYQSIYLYGEANYGFYKSQTTTVNRITSGQSINVALTTKPEGSRFLLGLGYQF